MATKANCGRHPGAFVGQETPASSTLRERMEIGTGAPADANHPASFMPFRPTARKSGTKWPSCWWCRHQESAQGPALGAQCAEADEARHFKPSSSAPRLLRAAAWVLAFSIRTLDLRLDPPSGASQRYSTGPVSHSLRRRDAPPSESPQSPLVLWPVEMQTEVVVRGTCSRDLQTASVRDFR